MFTYTDSDLRLTRRRVPLRLFRILQRFVLLSASVFCLCALSALPAFSQQRTVTGTVTDESGNPLPGVSVAVEHASTGTTTDSRGHFSLQVPSADATLEFSFIGYTTAQVALQGRSRVTVQLTPAVSALNQLVVIGYGKQKKSDLTGSISSLQTKDFNQGVAPSLDRLMMGKAAGVRVVQNSNEPGGGISVDIRGASSINAGTGPLYVIDGLPLDNSVPIGATG